MNFKKSYDYSDMSNFLPDNYTLATTNYFQKKYPKLPNEQCQMLEVLTREEYTTKDINECKEKIRNEINEYNMKLEKELLERQEEGKEEL